MKVSLLTAAILLVSGVWIAAEPGGDGLSFHTISLKDGLANTSVSGMVQDSRGFLWFGTQGGLNRYDGKNFKLFENEPFNPNSLSHNLIQTLWLDRDDVMWIGTYNGLNRFDIRTESFTIFRNEPGRADSLSHDLVIAINRDGGGRLWVGTQDGLNLLDEDTGRFKRFRNDPARSDSLPHNTVRSLFTDSSGRLWIGTAEGGLARLDGPTGRFTVFRNRPGDAASLPADAVMSIAAGEAGRLWVGTWGGGVSLFDPDAGTFRNWKLPDPRIYTVKSLNPDRVLAGSWGGGLYELDPRSGTVRSYRHSESNGSLPNNVVYSLMIDRTGGLWVGTNGGGIGRLDHASSSYSVWRADPKNPHALAQGKINSILVDSKGILWVGISDGGLNRYDRETGSWKNFRHAPGEPGSLANDSVNFIFEDSLGEFWVGTSGGLSRMDRERGSFTTLLPVTGRPDTIGSKIVTCMLEDGRGNLWVGTGNAGLDYYDRNTGVFQHYRHDPGDPSSLSDNLVSSLAWDSRGQLWVGTNGGLNRMRNGRFTRYFYDENRREGISNNSITTMLKDTQGTLWIGTRVGGLMKYLPESDSFSHITKRDGLPSNYISGIMEDIRGNLWVVTLTGVVLYDQATGAVKTVSALQNLNDDLFFTGNSTGRDGAIYFSSMNVLFRYDPAGYETNTHISPVFVTEVNTADKQRLGSPAASVEEPIRLGYRENSVHFRFAALDYRDPQANQFAYFLEGFDREWTYSGGQDFAAYSNLPGGRYIFRVRAANNDGLWNEQGAAIELKVDPPPWLSGPAMAVYLLLIAVLGYAIAALRSKRLLARKVRELTETKRSLEAANSRLEELSSVDALTGVANRRKFDSELAAALSFAIRAGAPISGLMIDLDFFKSYNDRYGHPAGDDCLKKAAAAMAAQLERSTDILARYGGEEFFLLLPSTALEGALLVAERLRAAVEALGIPNLDSQVARVVSVSIGCAALNPAVSSSTPAELIGMADAALYRAKQAGRSRVAV